MPFRREPCPNVSFSAVPLGARRLCHPALQICLMNPDPHRIVNPLVRTPIDAMLADPARTWSVAALAMLAGLSRAAFARRFVRAAGIAPERWLTRHRLRTAAWHLLLTDQRIVDVASTVGYGCEFAFSKAFK